MTTLGPEAMDKAARYCTCCRASRRIRHRTGVWVCTKCDGTQYWLDLNRQG